MAHRVFTKEILKSLNSMALHMGYNQAVTPEFLETLDDNKFYIPRITLLHEHKAGKPCDPHMRCVFDGPDGMFSIDVEMGCYEILSTFNEVRERIAQHEKSGACTQAE